MGASRSELGRRRRVRQVLRTGLLLGLFGAAAGMAWLWMEARWAEQDTRVEAERARAAEAQAGAEARHASSNLAVAYEERAVSALADGDPARAKIYAAATLELEERPAARGVLTDTHLWSPRLQRSTRIAQSCRFGILSPDSSTAACRAEDGSIVVDVDSGDLLLHRPAVAGVDPQAMTLDGDWFAAVEEGGRVNVYDIRTSALLRSLDVAAPRYTSVGLSKAAGLVAYASTERRSLVTVADGREKVWDSSIPFMGSLSISTDGSRIFHSGKGAIVRLDKERVTHRFNRVDRWFGTMLIDEEQGVLLTTSSPGTAYLLSVDELDPIREWKAHDNLIWGLAFQPGLILTSAADGSIRAWDREEATELGRISAHLGSIWSLSIKDGVLHSLGDDGFLRSWTLDIDPRTAATMRGLRGANAAWDRSGQVLVLEGPEGLRQISIDERGGSTTLPIPGLLISAADPSGGGRFVVAGGRLTRLDDRGGAEAVDLGSIPFIFPNIKVSPDGSILVVVDQAVSRIDVRRSTDGQVVSDRKLETSDSTFGLDISPDGRFVAMGSYDRTVRLFSLPTLEPIQRWEMSAEVSSVAFSPDGRSLATTLHDGGLRLLSLSGKEPDRGWTAHEGIASGLSWSPDGRWLATTGFSGGQRIWSVTTGALWAELPRLNQPVYHAAWSPDGATLATHAHDGSVRLFDMADLERPGSALRAEAEAETGLALVNGHLTPRP